MNTNKIIEKALKQVYDPEFPLVDIYTLGLIYKIESNDDDKTINILMTLTSPTCPMADLILEMTKNEVNEKLPNYEINIELTFEPLREPKLIKDKDIRQMFE